MTSLEDWIARLERAKRLHDSYLETVAEADKNYKEIQKIVEDLRRLNAPAETMADAEQAFEHNKRHLTRCMELLEEVCHLKQFTENMVDMKSQ